MKYKSTIRSGSELSYSIRASRAQAQFSESASNRSPKGTAVLTPTQADAFRKEKA